MNFSSNYKERPNLGIDYKAILRALMKNGIVYSDVSMHSGSMGLYYSKNL